MGSFLPQVEEDARDADDPVEPAGEEPAGEEPAGEEAKDDASDASSDAKASDFEEEEAPGYVFSNVRSNFWQTLRGSFSAV